MLRKKLGIEAIERDWNVISKSYHYFKITYTLIIPEGCEKVGNHAFEDYVWLEKIKIPKSVKEIGCCAFDKCKKLEKVVIPESVDWIRWSAFSHCWRATIILRKPESEFKEIGRWAFNGVRDVKEEIRS